MQAYDRIADRHNTTKISVDDAEILENYLKRELNYTSRVVMNSLNNKIYWYNILYNIG